VAEAPSHHRPWHYQNWWRMMIHRRCRRRPWEEDSIILRVALTGDSSLKPLTSRHDFVAVSHHKPFDTIFDTHLTFKTGNMTTFVLKDGFELVQAVYEGSEASNACHKGRNIATSHPFCLST
jgi:hypothetical protein